MGGGEDKMSVAFFSNAVKLKVNSSLCCEHETLPREPCLNKPVVPAPASSEASEKVLKKLPKKVIQTNKCENPPRILNSTKDFGAEKEPGGGVDKMSVASCSDGVEPKDNSSLCCAHKTLPKKHGQSKTIALGHFNSEDVSNKSAGGGMDAEKPCINAGVDTSRYFEGAKTGS